MKNILLITLALSLAIPAHAMEEESSLKQRINHAREEIAGARADTDRILQEDRPHEVKLQVGNAQFELAMLNFQLTALEGLNNLIETIEKRQKEEEKEKNTVAIGASTLLSVQEEDDFMVVSNIQLKAPVEECTVTLHTHINTQDKK